MNRYDMTLDGTENNLVQGLTVENPTGLKATLLSQTGKMQNLFLPYPMDGWKMFRSTLRRKTENGFPYGKTRRGMLPWKIPLKKDFLSTVRN